MGKRKIGFPDPLFVSKANKDTQDEYLTTNDSAVQAVRTADAGGDVVVVAEYKLVRTFRAKIKETLLDVK